VTGNLTIIPTNILEAIIKTLIKSVVAVLLLFSFSGCFEIETLVKVNKDGSGTVEETFLMGREIIDLVAQFSSAFGDKNDKSAFKIYNVKELKKNASQYGKGVIFVSSEKIVKEDEEGYKAVYKFSDINNLKIDQNPDSKAPMNSFGTEAFKKQTGDVTKFSFQKGKIAELTILTESTPGDTSEKEPEQSAEMQKDTTNAQLDPKMIALVKKIKFSFKLMVNGEVVETNATNCDGRTITLAEIDFGKVDVNPQSIKELSQMKDADETTIKAALKSMPGVKFEANKKINVRFK
jgi:hypothetical protein